MNTDHTDERQDMAGLQVTAKFVMASQGREKWKGLRCSEQSLGRRAGGWAIASG